MTSSRHVSHVMLYASPYPSPPPPYFHPFLVPPNLWQHRRRRSEMDTLSAHQTPLLGIRRTHPPVGLGVVGADKIAAARGSKRPRIATSSVSASCCLEHEKGKTGGGGGCCGFRWPDSGGYVTTVLKGEGAADAADGCGGDAGNAPELGGGCSAEHPSGMDVVEGGSGGGHESGSGLAEEQGGENGWRGVLGGASMSTGAGGSAVILSKFGAGGFPGYQWNQDQGGSSDDMLILYGSS